MGARLTAITKTFGPTVALRDVSFEAHAGRITALLGENGAGKSTAMGLFAGAISPDRGHMEVAGVPYRPRSPEDARRAGIAVVHQELSLCPHLTAEENIVLGVEPVRGVLLDRRASSRVARAALEAVGAPELHTERAVYTYPAAARQLVEIARALALAECKVLLLDEPTSSLGRAETERLFEIVRGLRDRGIAIVYVSHFLEEVKEICEDFVVLRDGEVVGRGRVADVTVADLIARMIGGQRVADSGARTAERGRRTEDGGRSHALLVEHLSGPGLRPSSLRVGAGEILGLFGLVGSGRTELLRAIFGLDRATGGTVRVGGWAGPGSPREALAHGLGMVSEDRAREGLLLERSLSFNVTLSRLRGWVRPAVLDAEARPLLARLRVKANGPGDTARSLSGGNQQKVALLRLLHRDVDVLLLDEPTRGVDVGAKAQILAEVRALAASGKAIVYVSSSMPELLEVADRVAVMRAGTLGEARDVSAWSEASLLAEAVGT